MTGQLVLALLPAIAYGLAGYALRPRGPVPAAGRLALVRAAVVVGGYAVATAEALSAGRHLGPGSVLGVWLAAVAVAGAAAAWRRRADRTPRASASRPEAAHPATPAPRPPRRRVFRSTSGRSTPGMVRDAVLARWRVLRRGERTTLVALAGLVLAELTLAVLSAPNTYDSQTYHLPRIEHWVAQGSVGLYPVAIHRQVTYPPGAEYLLLHLRLLTDGDALYGLVQWAAGVLCLLAVTRLVVQLGGGRRAQLFAAFVAGTMPALVLEASSTQVDLVVAGWVVSLATLVLDGVGRRPALAPRPGRVVLLGIATGLVAVTKSPALLLAGTLLTWWSLAWLRRAWTAGGARRRATAVGGVLASAAAIIAFTAALTGPYLWRTYQEFGNPLGPDYLRSSISMQRHDPAAILVNALRQGHTLFDTPIRPLSRAGAHAVERISRALGVDPSDPEITFDNATFPAVAWYPSEGKASLPIQALLLLVGAVAVAVRPVPRCATPQRRHAGARRLLVAVLAVSALAHIATVKWSPWANRFTLHLLVLAAPLAGLWLAAVTRRRPVRAAADRATSARVRTALAATMAGCLVVGGAAGWLSAVYGWPRRLVGSDSVFLLDDWRSRFVLRPDWADDYTAVGEAVRGSGARKIAIVQGNDSWEYPWWLLFKDRELVALQSQLPKHRVGSGIEFEALVCTAPVEVCQRYTPPGWRYVEHGAVGYALLPR